MSDWLIKTLYGHLPRSELYTMWIESQHLVFPSVIKSFWNHYHIIIEVPRSLWRQSRHQGPLHPVCYDWPICPSPKWPIKVQHWWNQIWGRHRDNLATWPRYSARLCLHGPAQPNPGGLGVACEPWVRRNPREKVSVVCYRYNSELFCASINPKFKFKQRPEQSATESTW